MTAGCPAQHGTLAIFLLPSGDARYNHLTKACHRPYPQSLEQLTPKVRMNNPANSILELDGIPHHSPDAQVQKFDDEVVIYFTLRKKAVYLNETAALIWELCDRTRTVADIVKLISDNYPDQIEQVREHIIEAIEQLWREGALRIKSTEAG